MPRVRLLLPRPVDLQQRRIADFFPSSGVPWSVMGDCLLARTLPPLDSKRRYVQSPRRSLKKPARQGEEGEEGATVPRQTDMALRGRRRRPSRTCRLLARLRSSRCNSDLDIDDRLNPVPKWASISGPCDRLRAKRVNPRSTVTFVSTLWDFVAEPWRKPYGPLRFTQPRRHNVADCNRPVLPRMTLAFRHRVRPQ